MKRLASMMWVDGTAADLSMVDLLDLAEQENERKIRDLADAESLIVRGSFNHERLDMDDPMTRATYWQFHESEPLARWLIRSDVAAY